MLTRQKKLTVRFTEREYAALQQKAAAAGFKMEPFVRSLVDGCEIKPRPPDSYKDLARELSAIGNNLNQIAHIANRTGQVTQRQLQQATDLMRQIWTLVQERI